MRGNTRKPRMPVCEGRGSTFNPARRLKLRSRRDGAESHMAIRGLFHPQRDGYVALSETITCSWASKIGAGNIFLGRCEGRLRFRAIVAG